ncbi:MAG: hypothetical protein A2X35_07875 [Elusimicrobia bacterium GWA2_61_42]|nr:MAG: hypothetical protein A2X35_07875 [Elusimicrobia bacterium GWA2_61_42]OGR76014.1 MAG: hypothetical protein A2X38_08185 [Elusimicrobia bacterium GWC2_61_25]
MFFNNAHCLVTDCGSVPADDAGRLEYLRLIENARRDFGLKLAAYALLPDRTLLYFVTPGADLHSVMGGINRDRTLPGYAAGHCKYKLIQPEKLSAALARFIHTSPVKAGLAAKPEDYKWSSAAQYLGLAEGPADKDIVLATLGDNPEAQLAKYSEFMAEPVPGKFWRPFDKNRDAVLGDRDFMTAHSPHQK